MDAAQKDVCGDPTAAQGMKKMFGPCFDYRQIADGIECLVLDRPQPPFVCWTFIQLTHLVHHKLPVPRGDLWIGRREISAGDLQIDGRLSFGFVFGMQHSNRGLPIFGSEGFLFPCPVVLAPEHLGLRLRQSPAGRLAARSPVIAPVNNPEAMGE